MSDYISREDALNFEMEIEADPEEIQAITKGMALYADYIKSIPAAEVVERKRGKWECVTVTDISDRMNLPFASISSMRCNQCNRYHNEVYHYGIPTEMARFCSFCGAWMVNDERT